MESPKPCQGIAGWPCIKVPARSRSVGRPLAAIRAETGADHAAAGSDISVALPQAGRQDDIACVLRVVSEAPLAPLTYNVGQGGERGLFAIGIQDGLWPLLHPGTKAAE